ncbi:hypothetical protein QR680_008568 [Steinernema hermaphroditum]|uniref:Uncharacterized protein n=1 Tax=Steinernema hermaphroditum TaxID=289476 RepID=A0AA39IIK7_9BILA|nr:hypothetical protein QR680_008568 [Steinernema hermaphroditum]
MRGSSPPPSKNGYRAVALCHQGGRPSEPRPTPTFAAARITRMPLQLPNNFAKLLCHPESKVQSLSKAWKRR